MKGGRKGKKKSSLPSHLLLANKIESISYPNRIYYGWKGKKEEGKKNWFSRYLIASSKFKLWKRRKEGNDEAMKEEGGIECGVEGIGFQLIIEFQSLSRE